MTPQTRPATTKSYQAKDQSKRLVRSARIKQPATAVPTAKDIRTQRGVFALRMPNTDRR